MERGTKVEKPKTYFVTDKRPASIEARGAAGTAMEVRPREPLMLPAFIEARGVVGTMVKMQPQEPQMLSAFI